MHTLPLISFPTVLHGYTLSGTTPQRSWIQLAKTGSFVSKRYGHFDITKGDLAQMYYNFQHITPKAPTELPIDYDHLSMAPAKPGDGIAAGWMKRLELRQSGDELWAEVEWTPTGADHIAKQEYKFISPSFVKDYVHKDGQKIGTTLLAAAVTNHPFLEQMSAITLYNFVAHGHLAVPTDIWPRLEKKPMTLLHLAAIGDRVSFTTDTEKVPELTPKERTNTYTVKAVMDAGETQFVRLVHADSGDEFGWFAADQLAPAPAANKDTLQPAPMEMPVAQTAAEAAALAAITPMGLSADQATSELIALAHQIATDEHQPFNDAQKLAGKRRPDLVSLRNGHTPTTPTEAAPISLAADSRAGTFLQLVRDLKTSRKITDTAAYSLAATLRPDLAEKYSAGREL